uniref:Ovule protein n=1 Tax=Ascaris lumbricoides TaxID=6252 RepID=A0A0M3IPT3_ASCLU
DSEFSTLVRRYYKRFCSILFQFFRGALKIHEVIQIHFPSILHCNRHSHLES